MKCPNCGADVENDAKICPSCGVAFVNRVEDKSMPMDAQGICAIVGMVVCLIAMLVMCIPIGIAQIFGGLVMLIGLVCGGIGLYTKNRTSKRVAIAALIMSGVYIVIFVVGFVVIISLLLGGGKLFR